jgi:tritrans,polycis-undecaprenyl-diphosphate synthase [geranylgeranyl-diphosphate specific]
MMKNSFFDTLLKRLLLTPAYRAYQIRLEREIREGPIPRCIGVIMDGNRRWARGEGRLPWEGHREGKAKVKVFLEWCTDTGIRSVVLYSFSAENFSRRSGEVGELMRLFKQGFEELSNEPTIMEKGVRVRVIGNLGMLPAEVQEVIRIVEEKTRDNKNYDLAFAIAYGGREEILHACRSIARDVREGAVEIEDIDENLFRKNLYASDIPDPDMVIRTSGEQRLSGFLPWQATYSELFFVDVHWPAFRKIDFLRLLRIYQQRERRIGS